MKKLLYSLLCLSFIMLGITGCTNSKSAEETEKILTDNGYVIDTNYLNRVSFVCMDSEKEYYRTSWDYFKDKNAFVFDSNGYKDTDDTIIVDLNKEIAYDGIYDIEENNDTSANSIKKIIDAGEKLAKSFDLSTSDIENFLKNKLDQKIEEYNKMSYKDKLIIHFENNEEEINKLSDDEAKKYYEIYNENKNLTFNEIQEKIYLESDKIPSDIKNVIENMKEKSSKSSSEWSMKNFKLLETENTKGINYNWYLENTDTQIDFMFVFDENSDSFDSISMYSKNAVFEVDDVEDILVMYMVLMQCVDETIDETDALTIANNCYNKSYVHNGYAYYTSLDPDLTMMIIPEK